MGNIEQERKPQKLTEWLPQLAQAKKNRVGKEVNGQHLATKAYAISAHTSLPRAACAYAGFAPAVFSLVFIIDYKSHISNTFQLKPST
jgi:hypothetical protein